MDNLWAIGLGLLGGLGGSWMLRGGVKRPQDSSEPPPDRLAQLERMIETYRGEVTDLQDRVDRWGRRLLKREEREGEAKPAEISTGFPQGESSTMSKEQLRLWWATQKAQNRRR